MTKKKADALGYDRWLRKKEHKPVVRYKYKDLSVFISEGGPYHRKNDDHPLGWYETAYAIGQDDNMLCLQVLEFSFAHDIQGLTDESRRLGRINAAKKAVHAFIDEAEEKLNGKKSH